MKNEYTKTTGKKVSKIILIVLASIIGLIVLYIAVFIPIKNKFEEHKYERLSQNMNNLYQDMLEVAEDSEELIYKNECAPEYTGDWPTGKYYCKSSIKLDKPISDVSEVSSAQSRFFKIVDNNNFMKPITELFVYYPEYFGKEFVVSSVEKDYNTSDIRCKFSNDLIRDDKSYNIDQFGDKIYENEGRLLLSISCTGLTSKSWYKLNYFFS